MKRQICAGCERPAKVCLCKYLKPIANLFPVTVLRHKSEAKHALNTVNLLQKTLDRISVVDGEYFQQDSLTLSQDSYLVYPGDDALNIEDIEDIEVSSSTNFVLLDGSWKKTRKILYCNPWLEKLPKVKLPQQASRYFLRKQKEQGFSTLEAAHSILSKVENDEEKYQGLLKILDQLMEIQSSFIEAETLEKHFGERLSKISSDKNDSKAASLSDRNSPGGILQHPKT